MNSLLQQLGGSIGIAVFGVLHQIIYSHYLDKKYAAAAGGTFCLAGRLLVSAIVIGLGVDTRYPTTGPARHAIEEKFSVLNIKF